MVFISTKTINGKKRHYIEESFRLPNGKTKKTSIYLKDYDPKQKDQILRRYQQKLKEKKEAILINHSISQYKANRTFTKDLIKSLEEIRLGYKEITKKLTKKQMRDIIDRFTVNFTYESNAIEGNSLTIKDVTMILQEKKVIKNKDLREIYETVNTKEAMNLIFSNKLKINEDDIKKLHQILVKNTGINYGYKEIPNILIGRNVKTTAPEKVKQEMDKLIEGYQQNKDMHPLQKVADFHGKFERIHPFEDGNGRTGRLLINIMLLEYGYPPLIIRKSHKINYFNALSAFDNNSESKLYWFLIGKYKSTYRKFFEIYVKYLNKS